MLGFNGGLNGGQSADLTEVVKTYGTSESRLLLFALLPLILIVVVVYRHSLESFPKTMAGDQVVDANPVN